jgi:hypothetical protein
LDESANVEESALRPTDAIAITRTILFQCTPQRLVSIFIDALLFPLTSLSVDTTWLSLDTSPAPAGDPVPFTRSSFFDGLLFLLLSLFPHLLASVDQNYASLSTAPLAPSVLLALQLTTVQPVYPPQLFLFCFSQKLFLKRNRLCALITAVVYFLRNFAAPELLSPPP